MKDAWGRAFITLRPAAHALRLHHLQAAHAAAQDLVAHRREMQRDEQQREGDRHHQQRNQECVGSSVGPPMRITEAGWCSVFHQSTENLMIGRLIAPTSVSTAAARAAREGSSTARHSAISAEIHQEQDQHRGEPRVPFPIGAPHRPAPQRAGDQRKEGEGRADRGCGLRRDVGERMPPHQRAERGRRSSRPRRTSTSHAFGTWMNMIFTVAPC